MIEEKITNAYKDIKGFTKELFRETAAEVIILALLGATAGGFISHKIESNRDKLIPLAFSEISQIKDTAKHKKKKVDSFTLYHAGLNDLVMKVLESWNDSWRYSKSDKEAYAKFAEILDQRMTGQGKYNEFRHDLWNFLRDVPKQAEINLEKLGGFIKAKKRMSVVNSNFSNAWTEKHNDNYHTEIYPSIETYSDGKNMRTRTVMRTRQVYDDTDHYYNYHRKYGKLASTNLDSILLDFGDLSLKINMSTVKNPQSENLEAINLSRKIKKGEELTPSEYRGLINRWNFGSNFAMNKNVFANPFASLHKDAVKWRIHKNTAKNKKKYHYNTTSRSHSGPKEYQTAKKALVHGRHFTNSIHEVVDGMEYVRQHIPQLESKIKGFTDYMIRSRHYPDLELDPEKVSYEIKDAAISMYKENFKGGFDAERYRTWMVFLLGLAGLVGGAALGFGVDKAGERFNLWNKDSPYKYR